MNDKNLVRVGEASGRGFGFGNIPQGGFVRGLYGVRVGDAVVGSYVLQVARAAVRLVKAGVDISKLTEEEIRFKDYKARQ